MGPTAVDALPGWMKQAVDWAQQQGETWQQQPMVKLLNSNLGQAAMLLSGEPRMKMNLLEGVPVPPSATMGRAFNGALEDYYGLPPASGKPTRQPKATAVNNIYDQLVAMGKAAPPEELAKLQGQTQQRAEVFRKELNPAVPEVGASARLRAQTILDHIAKTQGYKVQPGDLDNLTQRVQDIQNFGSAPNSTIARRLSEEGAKTQDRKLGEVVRQVVFQMQKPNGVGKQVGASNVGAPEMALRNAMKNASGWAQYDAPSGGKQANWRAGQQLDRLAMIQQMGNK